MPMSTSNLMPAAAAARTASSRAALCRSTYPAYMVCTIDASMTWAARVAAHTRPAAYESAGVAARDSAVQCAAMSPAASAHSLRAAAARCAYAAASRYDLLAARHMEA